LGKEQIERSGCPPSNKNGTAGAEPVRFGNFDMKDWTCQGQRR